MSFSDLGLPEPSEDAPGDPHVGRTPKEYPAPAQPDTEPVPTREFTPPAAREPKPPREPKTPRQPKTPREPKPAREPKTPKPARMPKPARAAAAARPPQPPGGRQSRTPLILGIIAGILAVAIAVTVVIGLNRSDEPDPAPAPSTSDPAPSTAASPTTDPVAEPAEVTFSGTGFTLVDDAGEEIFSYLWSDSATAAVAELTEAFGAAPTERIEPGDGSHYPDYTVYQWDGFYLFDMIQVPGGVSRSEYVQPSYVVFSRNEVGGIQLVAERGLHIGMSVQDARALGPDREIQRGSVGATRLVFEQARSSADGVQYSLFADTDGQAVTAILYYRYADL